MRARLLIPALAGTLALLLTGCVDNSAPAATGDTEAASGSSLASTAGKDAAAIALLPAALVEAGTLKVGTDASYAPNEFKDEAGNPIGWGIDIATAIAARLDLTPKFQVAKFDNIIPSVKGGKVDIGMSSFLDTVEREEQVDFVNYYIAGTQWAAPAGTTVDPDNACGLTVAVQQTTYQDTVEMPAKIDACVAAGAEPITLLRFDTQDAATNAVAIGQADAVTAASPVILYGIGQLDGALITAGETFSVAPYGIAVGKESDLREAVQAAVQSLVDDGTYAAILEDWNVAGGQVTAATINAGATATE
ncbi:ABC transporter substrate-binding protein [Cryobacterium frigoriphilum]|uniref:ABC transporter substrate-binding protein n=1 Tax=Cryobacterium frigoriphilum TaxID=1259150 RepID=A0A4R9A1W3_9MICO|nr:ABC transporter substrate-binding protein [Cryobacterium frigoriphilum]TFD50183.1 ABC transporter substrate-binding protein [Cryobacterium frigoriphilum]